MDSFGERVAGAVARTGPLCAGIDPSSALLGEWGLPDDADGLRAFGSRCIEAFAGVVPVVKAQVAFFERLGSAGFAALEALLADARDAGLLVIADAKRGDIPSTSEAYAGAWLDGSSPLAADAVTVTPYLGLGALQPLFDAARAGGRGVIVVVRSSNPEGRLLQEATMAGGDSVEDGLLAGIAGVNRAQGGTVGVVVGANLHPSGFPLSQVGGVILTPGVGAQGATASEVAELFSGCPEGAVLPNASRSLLAAGPSVGALRAAAGRVREEMAVALSQKR